MHLGLVGALEAIAEHFRKIPRVHEAYRCEAVSEKMGLAKKNSHHMGKAVHISVEGVVISEVFKFAETVPEIRGIGLYPKENFIHIDTRYLDKNEEKDKWIKEGGKVLPLTSELRSKYNLS